MTHQLFDILTPNQLNDDKITNGPLEVTPNNAHILFIWSINFYQLRCLFLSSFCLFCCHIFNMFNTAENSLCESCLMFVRAFLSESSLRCSTLGQAPAWPCHKHYTKLERPARDKHCSLLQTFVNYSSKKL